MAMSLAFAKHVLRLKAEGRLDELCSEGSSQAAEPITKLDFTFERVDNPGPFLEPSETETGHSSVGALMPAGVKCDYHHQPQKMEPDEYFVIEEMPMHPGSSYQVYGRLSMNPLTGKEDWVGEWYDVDSTEASRAPHSKSLMTVWAEREWRYRCFEELKEHPNTSTIYPAGALAQELEEMFDGVPKVRAVLFCKPVAKYCEKVLELIKDTHRGIFLPLGVLNLYNGKNWTRANCRLTSIMPIGADCEVHVAGYPKFAVKVGTFVLLPGPLYIKVYSSQPIMSVYTR